MLAAWFPCIRTAKDYKPRDFNLTTGGDQLYVRYIAGMQSHPEGIEITKLLSLSKSSVAV